MSRSKRQKFEQLQGVCDDIYNFADACRFIPHTQQRWVLDAIMEGDGQKFTGIAVKSGQGPGKTAVGALIALWRALRVERSLTVYTAPSLRQIKDSAFAEITSHVTNMPGWLKKYFTVDTTRVSIAGDRHWGIQGMTSSTGPAVQGPHRPEGLTVIMEETSGITRDIFQTFEGTLSQDDSLMVCIGNPNTRDCIFFDMFQPGKKEYFKKFTFNCEDTAKWHPNILAKERNERLELDYGRHSDVYRVRVLGEFPLTDPNTIIPAHLLEACTSTSLIHKAMAVINPNTGRINKQIGADFARFGGDENSTTSCYGNAAIDLWAKANVEPIEALEKGYEFQAMQGWGNNECTYVCDASGIGQGVMYNVTRSNRNLYEFHNGSTPFNRSSYKDKITEAWFSVREKLKMGEPIYIPNDRILIDQLVNRQYFMTKDNLLIIESKDHYEARGYNSPDRAESWIMAMYPYASVRSKVETKSE